MPTNFHERFAADDVKPPSDRATGLVFAAAALVATVLWRGEPTIFWGGLVAAAALALVSMSAPVLLKPLNYIWFRLGLLMHRIVSPIVMLTLFLVMFVPAGMLMRIWHDPLRARRKPEASSYWIERSESGRPITSMANQF
jgi:hypothetical protein